MCFKGLSVEAEAPRCSQTLPPYLCRRNWKVPEGLWTPRSVSWCQCWGKATNWDLPDRQQRGGVYHHSCPLIPQGLHPHTEFTPWTAVQTHSWGVEERFPSSQVSDNMLPVWAAAPSVDQNGSVGGFECLIDLFFLLSVCSSLFCVSDSATLAKAG